MPMTQVGCAYDSTIYYRARYYDTSIGRFVSEDPVGFWGGLNFYAYVLNDPAGLTDPMGESPCLNIRNFVDAMNTNTHGKTTSGHNCAQAVKNGLNAGFGGNQANSLHNGPQNYGPGLQQLGFTPIDSTTYKPGDIMIFQPPGKNPNGHIQVWNGRQWVSDFMQPPTKDYPGPGSFYKNNDPDYQLYRDFNPCP